MKAEIQAAVKSAYLQYGLKLESIEKIVNAIEVRLSAGTIEPENLQTAIKAEVEIYRPLLAVMQSEIDSSKVKRPTDPPTPIVNPPAPADDSTTALLKTLMEKITGLENKDAEHRKATTKQELITKALEISGKQGATNSTLLKKAIKLIDIQDDMTAEQISGLALSEYNELQSSISKDGAVPIIPALGDKATVEAAQKKGVDLVDKFLGKAKA